MISVLIVEDQTIVREGLVRLLQFSSEVTVIGHASNGKEALDLLESLLLEGSAPDVILLDIQMPVMDGFEFLHAGRQMCTDSGRPFPRTILLTTFTDRHYLQRAQQMNVQGFLLKDVCFEELVLAIQRVHAGEKLMPVPGPAENQAELSEPALLLESLTAREREIFARLCEGMANKEVARSLALSEGTVKNHVSNILAKLGVRDRTQAVIRFGSMERI
ncbi:MAG: response regulator transcription factor [Gammaproteobacteria bacterium]|nr:response regulator transcription factor [Gammaproteobacteria bacterium]